MKKIYFIIFACLITIEGISQTGGKYTYQVLSLPYNSRIAAIGGNNVSHYDNDLNFVLQNPALLRNKMSDKLSVNYINYISDINLGNIAFSKYFEKAGIFAAGIQFANYGKFKNTDYTGIIYDNFTVADYVFYGAYSHKLYNEKFRIGANFKFIWSDYWKYSSVGIAFDAGISYIDTVKNFSAGLVIKNAGFQLKTYTKGNFEPLPFDIQIGLTKKFEHAPIRISVTARDLLNWKLAFESKFDQENYVIGEVQPKKTFFNKLGNVADEFIRHFVFGVEIIPHKAFHIDLGFNTRRRMELTVPVKKSLVGFSAGVGFELTKFNFGYGIACYTIAGLSHHITFGLNLNSFYKKKTTSE
ncbi:MAG: type IX secretion system protein PorQ [Bacteroidales bacterium]|jgi:hypothetical protein|nr:type IX secretion system protein PorQ [Bacteroidales bacterium]